MRAMSEKILLIVFFSLLYDYYFVLIFKILTMSEKKQFVVEVGLMAAIVPCVCRGRLSVARRVRFGPVHAGLANELQRHGYLAIS